MDRIHSLELSLREELASETSPQESSACTINQIPRINMVDVFDTPLSAGLIYTGYLRFDAARNDASVAFKNDSNNFASVSFNPVPQYMRWPASEGEVPNLDASGLPYVRETSDGEQFRLLRNATFSSRFFRFEISEVLDPRWNYADVEPTGISPSICRDLAPNNDTTMAESVAAANECASRINAAGGLPPGGAVRGIVRFLLNDLRDAVYHGTYTETDVKGIHMNSVEITFRSLECSSASDTSVYTSLFLVEDL